MATSPSHPLREAITHCRCKLVRSQGLSRLAEIQIHPCKPGRLAQEHHPARSSKLYNKAKGRERKQQESLSIAQIPAPRLEQPSHALQPGRTADRAE